MPLDTKHGLSHCPALKVSDGMARHAVTNAFTLYTFKITLWCTMIHCDAQWATVMHCDALWWTTNYQKTLQLDCHSGRIVRHASTNAFMQLLYRHCIFVYTLCVYFVYLHTYTHTLYSYIHWKCSAIYQRKHVVSGCIESMQTAFVQTQYVRNCKLPQNIIPSAQVAKNAFKQILYTFKFALFCVFILY